MAGDSDVVTTQIHGAILRLPVTDIDANRAWLAVVCFADSLPPALVPTAVLQRPAGLDAGEVRRRSGSLAGYRFRPSIIYLGGYGWYDCGGRSNPSTSLIDDVELGSTSPPHVDGWIAALGSLPLMCQPGERWLYNSSAQVLGSSLRGHAARIWSRCCVSASSSRSG